MRVSAWHRDWTKEDLPLHARHARFAQGHDEQQHLFHELVYVVGGSCLHRDAGGGHRLRGGDLVLLHPQSWHAYERCRRLEHFVCVWRPDLLRKQAPLLGGLGPLFDHLRRRHPRPIDQAPLVLQVPPRLRSRIIGDFTELEEELEQRPTGWRAAAIGRIVDILVILARLLERIEPIAAPRPNDRGDAAVLAAVELMEAAPEEAWTLDRLSQQVELSTWQLSRRFRRRMGLGLSIYLQHLRIEQACRRMALSDAPITAIALDVGFDDPAYFSRVFRRIAGCSPREYRQRLG
ncbi:MAG: helix-turn-helix domain-containing protein [Planctomycetota bacterium]